MNCYKVQEYIIVAPNIEVAKYIAMDISADIPVLIPTPLDLIPEFYGLWCWLGGEWVGMSMESINKYRGNAQYEDLE